MGGNEVRFEPESGHWPLRSPDHLERAAQLNPNDAHVFAHRSALEMFTGEPQRAMHSLDIAMKLNPTPPNWYREIEGLVFYALRRYEDAARAWERATARRPYVYRFLAALPSWERS